MTQQPNINVHGAVDLSALAPQQGAAGQSAGAHPGQAQGGQPGQTVPGPYSLDLTEATLPTVMQTSASVPVVIVVHSQRAQGSAQMAQELSDLAREMGGRFQVARVDADTESGFVQALGVQALPSVIILLGGQPVPAFQGTADKEQIRGIMDQILGMAQQNGISGMVDGSGQDDQPAEPEPEPLDPNMQAGLDAIEAGDLDAAEAAFRKASIEDPRGDEPRAALAQVVLMKRVTSGTEEPAEVIDRAQQAADSEVDVQLAAADIEVSTGRAQEGLERVLRVIIATSGEEKERARQRLLELFDVVGQQSPEVASVRRRLASALY